MRPHYMPRFLVLVSLAVGLAAAAPRAMALPDVQVLAVGSNRSFKAGLKPLKFAESDARRFAAAMETVGLVPSARATVLTDATVAEFRAAFGALAALAKQEDGDAAPARKFVFYFSGHSDDAGLHLKDGFISKDELHDLIGTIDAHTRIAILDSCFSGAITAKGVVDAPAFELPRLEFDEPSGTVFLAASSGHQLAYESDDLGGSVFTHYLLQGLYGAADANGRGVVTLDELYQYVYRNTKWQSLSYPTQSVQEPEYVVKLQGQGAIVLSFPAQTSAKLALAKGLKGEITIASPKGIQFFKVDKEAGQEKLVQLPVGDYQLSVRDGQRVGSGEVRLDPARLAFLGQGDVSWQDGDAAKVEMAKGEANPAPAPPPRASDWAIAAGGHSGYIAGGAVGPFVELGYAQPLASAGRWAFRGGAALSYHRNQATPAEGAGFASLFPDPSTFGSKAVVGVTTQSAALYGTTAARFQTPWPLPVILGVGVGAGEAYHDEKFTTGTAAYVDENGWVPGASLGLDAELTLATGRRVGLTYRQEWMRTSGVSPSSLARAHILALTSTL